MNAKVQALIVRAEAALKTGLGGTINVALGPDGQVLIGRETPPIISYKPPGFAVPADCTITLPGGLSTLEKFEAASNFTRAFMLADGEVVQSGDRALAEKFAGALQAAA